VSYLTKYQKHKPQTFTKQSKEIYKKTYASNCKKFGSIFMIKDFYWNLFWDIPGIPREFPGKSLGYPQIFFSKIVLPPPPSIPILTNSLVIPFALLPF
jgi:hypothetical protein